MKRPPALTVTLLGAAGVVTGSAYQLRTEKAHVLLDFGMFQGSAAEESRNEVPAALKPTTLNAVILTHAHLDHCGRLPLLAKAGYAGPIFATPATIDLAGLILRDSAKIQASDNERINRRLAAKGKPPVQPLYGIEEVEKILSQFQPVPYTDPVEVAPGMKARFHEAGHILGSASVEITVGEAGHQRTVVFSGDIGPKGVPILKDFVCLPHAHAVFMESTYGDRNHRPLKETVAEFEAIVKRAVERKGKLIVPTFAVGRAQLLLVLMALMFRKRSVPPFPIYLDSPMAITATQIYREHEDLYDEEMLAFIREQPLLEDLRSVTNTLTADQSKKINDDPGPCLVMAGSGMCNGGRILHHLKHNLPLAQSEILIVGFQGEGSLGRQLVDRSPEVSIFGERIPVRASIHTLGGFSAHAGQKDLLEWLGCMAHSGPRVVLTHGEDRARAPLAALIEEKFRRKCDLPVLGDVIEIA
jgi:metallo-beta-lactamase family protein